MGYVDSTEGRCKKHPNHRLSTGVCPSCLRERLTQLSCASNNHASIVSDITMDGYCYYSNSSSSEISSPVKTKSLHHRNASDVMNSMVCMASSDIERGLTKSRSMAFVPKERVGEAKFEKKKVGFWSKLLHLKGKKMDKHYRAYTVKV